MPARTEKPTPAAKIEKKPAHNRRFSLCGVEISMLMRILSCGVSHRCKGVRVSDNAREVNGSLRRFSKKLDIATAAQSFYNNSHAYLHLPRHRHLRRRAHDRLRLRGVPIGRSAQPALPLRRLDSDRPGQHPDRYAAGAALA